MEQVTLIIKKLSLGKLLAIAVLFFIVACDQDKLDNENFRAAYKEILIARETEADSLKANDLVKDILQEHGYSEEDFRIDYFALSQDRKAFIRLLGEIRKEAALKSDSIKTAGVEVIDDE
ncbi:MAG: hypothetical protein B7C24_16755 [Bacteroidetes bacterium 4572_77]|nr:MAG: hypothetical protein B7C24_16755 [Bacteroidetes bacterium 4572_77]